MSTNPAEPKPLYHLFNEFIGTVTTKLDLRQARTALLLAAAFNFLGNLLDLKIITALPGTPTWPALAAIGISALIFVSAVILRHWLRTGAYEILFIVNSSMAAFAIYYTEPYFASGMIHWSPFQANKLGCLFAALLAPSFRVGIYAIMAHVVASYFNFVDLPADMLAKVTPVEPTALFVFGLAGIFILCFRMRAHNAQKKLHHIQSDVVAVKRIAEEFLQLRDQMNTPIQVMEFSLQLLQAETAAKDASVMPKMQRAVERLREITTKLAKFNG